MTTSSPVSGEVFDTKLAAIFNEASLADEARQAVQDALALPDAQVCVIRPGDPAADRKLEPEIQGIKATMVRSHVTMGAAGLVAGVVAWLVLHFIDIPMITQSSWLSLGALLFFGGIGGLLVGGLISLRPDHDRYVHTVKAALRKGRSAVVVHARSAEERARAAALLEGRGGRAVSSI